MISGIVIALLVVLTAGSGAVFKPGSWYDGLSKPGWTPPNWAFPVVWTILYVFIGVAGWRVWQAAGWSLPMALWGAQLALNAGWSALFFGMKRMDYAMACVSALLLSILAFIVFAQPIDTAASLLFLPYLAWVATAAALNLRFLQMNPTRQRPSAALSGRR